MDEEACSAALEHVCLLVGTGIQLTAFSEGAPSGLPGAIAIACWDHIYDTVCEGDKR
jgi:hypothetical protein